MVGRSVQFQVGWELRNGLCGVVDGGGGGGGGWKRGDAWQYLANLGGRASIIRFGRWTPQLVKEARDRDGALMWQGNCALRTSHHQPQSSRIHLASSRGIHWVSRIALVAWPAPKARVTRAAKRDLLLLILSWGSYVMRAHSLRSRTSPAHSAPLVAIVQLARNMTLIAAWANVRSIFQLQISGSHASQGGATAASPKKNTEVSWLAVKRWIEAQHAIAHINLCNVMSRGRDVHSRPRPLARERQLLRILGHSQVATGCPRASNMYVFRCIASMLPWSACLREQRDDVHGRRLAADAGTA